MGLTYYISIYKSDILDLIIIIVSVPQGNVDNIVQAKEEISPSERIELYHQIEAEFFERFGTFPIVPLYSTTHNYATADWFILETNYHPEIIDLSNSEIDMASKEAARGE